MNVAKMLGFLQFNHHLKVELHKQYLLLHSDVFILAFSVKECDLLVIISPKGTRLRSNLCLCLLILVTDVKQLIADQWP